ncbi:M56 family metallopeptidase [Flagellimonas amoyensis]|uniref:M56 family metallopeptidase n=1 Tax=Flagellimonas amoyensis TaxID=2169401 RepID=UPI000D37B037|nr:M56 family metallopeptidase [Allomuricauda amoyensis]
MLVFLLKSTACLVIFLSFYKLVLEKESIHQFKRFFLLGALIASFLIPAVVFTEYVDVPEQIVLSASPIAGEIPSTATEQVVAEKSYFDWEIGLWLVYSIGVIGFGIRFLRNLTQIALRIRKNPKFKENFITRVLLRQSLPPHTFFNYIFLNQRQFEEKHIPQEVLLHEETHAKQRHSLDILFIEMAQVILWFNPIIYLFKSSIKLNHEFLADRAVINGNHDHSHYQNTILSYLSHGSFEQHQSTGIANAINYSSIKKRFTVMKTNTSRKSFVLRSLLVLPLTALLLFGFSEKRQIEKWDPTEKVLTLDGNASPSDLKTYHELAKKYNAIPIEQRIIPLEDLKELERIYRKMDETQKENALPFPECSPKEEGQKTIEFIEIFINNNGKLVFQSNIVPLEDLKEMLSKVNEHLSFDQRKKVVRSVIQVEAQTPKNVIQQVDKILTEYGSATINIVGPETSMQSSATRGEMKEYNALAKKYNAMDRNHMVIKKQEVNRLKEIYGKMSKKQQEDAEPFPNFPPPPPAPDAPEPVQHAPATEAAIPSPPGVMPAQEPNSALPAPPPPPEPKSPLEHIKEMAGKGATFMHNGKEITAKEAIRVLENNKRINVDSRGSDSGKPIVKLSTEPIVIEN